jgi:hypothetical protein
MPTSHTEESGVELEEDFELNVVDKFTPVDDMDSITAASPKRYVTAARLGGFAVIQAGTSRTVQRQAPFKSGKNAGETKPDRELNHLWLTAGTKGMAVFTVHFVDNRFESAIVWDAAGWPKELWADYTPSGRALARMKEEPQKPFDARVDGLKQRGLQQGSDYNDGEFWVDKRPRSLGAASAFEEWLADLVPGFEPRKKPASKKQQQATATVVELTDIGEWIG